MWKKEFFGNTKAGEGVYRFTWKNQNESYISILNYGGIVQSLGILDAKGSTRDVVLGYDEVEEYESNTSYFGALIGRNANRIEDSFIRIDGKKISLRENEKGYQLHGGIVGFDRKVWRAETDEQGILRLFLKSEDGDQGFPGNLDIVVTYSFSDEQELTIQYNAVSDADTMMNMTNHSYFNLNGQGSGVVDEQEIVLHADFYTEMDRRLFTTGVVSKVEKTALDFRQRKKIGQDIGKQEEQLLAAGGYDHNFILREQGKGLKKAAQCFGMESGIQMEVFTTKPGVQFYTGNFISEGMKGKQGAVYGKRHGFCLETQYFPGGMKYSHFPSMILEKQQRYEQKTVYKFGIGE